MMEESALENLVSGYFHEDWDIEGPTVEGVIDTYLRDARPEDVDEVLSEIAILLNEPEDDVAQRLRNWYLMYDYTVDDMDAHGWLRRVQAPSPPGRRDLAAVAWRNYTQDLRLPYLSFWAAAPPVITSSKAESCSSITVG